MGLFYCLSSENQVQLGTRTSPHDLRFYSSSEQTWHGKFKGFVENCISTSAARFLAPQFLQHYRTGEKKKPNNLNYPLRTVFMSMLGFSSKHTTKQILWHVAAPWPGTTGVSH